MLSLVPELVSCQVTMAPPAPSEMRAVARPPGESETPLPDEPHSRPPTKSTRWTDGPPPVPPLDHETTTPPPVPSGAIEGGSAFAAELSGSCDHRALPIEL